MLTTLFLRKTRPTCARSADRVSIFLPETVNGPVSWEIPLVGVGDSVSTLIDTPDGQGGGMRNLLVVESAGHRKTAVMRSEDAARDAVAAIASGLSARRIGAGRRFGGGVGIALGTVATLALVGVVGFHSRAPGATAPQPPALEAGAGLTPAPGAAPAQQQTPLSIDAEGMTVLKKIRDTQGIALTPITDKSRVLYVFEDPNCPHCRSLMTTIAQLPSDITAVIMPVAFFPGSDVATSQVMCASDKVAAWNSVVQGQPPKGAKECGPGSATVNLNTRLFSGVGFTATPTIVADNGKVMIGEGSVSDLQTLLK